MAKRDEAASGGSATDGDDELQQINFRVTKKLHRQAKRMAALNQVSLAKYCERLVSEDILSHHQELEAETEREVQEVLAEKKALQDDLAAIAAQLQNEGGSRRILTTKSKKE